MIKRIVRPIVSTLILTTLLGCATTDKFLGNIWPNGIGPGVPEAEFWNQLTPENAGKWASVEATRDVMDWSGLDAAWAYSRERGIPFRYHTLIWGQQYPAWLRDLSPEEQREEIEQWFASVSERYPDPEFIDVVNEPVHEIPVFIDALGGYGETGWDWVVTSFELARKYFPRSKLHLNDYKLLLSGSTAQSYLRVVKILKERKLIDGMGMQAHFLELAKPETVQNNLELLAEAGLPLYVTEFDIDLPNNRRQADQWAALFPIFYEHPAVKGITLWGSMEGVMWQKHGFLIKKDGSWRESMVWLDDYLNRSER